MEAATEISWKKRCSYKQLFWKLPGEIFSQNSWKISLKKFIFSKVAQSCSQKFLPKNKTGEKHNFHKHELLKMNFFIGIFQIFWLQISEHLFPRTPLKWLLLQRRVQDFVKMELFVNIINGLKPFSQKSSILDVSQGSVYVSVWSYKFYLSNIQVQSLLPLMSFLHA